MRSKEVDLLLNKSQEFIREKNEAFVYAKELKYCLNFQELQT